MHNKFLRTIAVQAFVVVTTLSLDNTRAMDSDDAAARTLTQSKRRMDDALRSLRLHQNDHAGPTKLKKNLHEGTLHRPNQFTRNSTYCWTCGIVEDIYQDRRREYTQELKLQNKPAAKFEPISQTRCALW